MRRESEMKVRKATAAPIAGRKAQPQTGFSAPLTLRKAAEGLKLERFFTRPGADPFDEIEWEVRAAVISNEKGEIVFEQRDVEVPQFRSQPATHARASQYLRRSPGPVARER